MRYTFTYPMHHHPHHPHFATGSGVGTIARAAEKAGFSGLGFTDHPAPSKRWLENGGHDALDPFVAMGFAAAHTTTMRLIPNVLVLPYRNPFVVAKSGATLDVLSGGRFTLAVGVGYLRREFEALGVAFEQRGDIMDESLRLIRAIWTSDDVTFDGRHFTAQGITAHPQPVAHPHPPIWIGGNSRAARRRVAEYGTGWCPFPAPVALARTARTDAMTTLDDLRMGIEDMRHRCEDVGRDPSEIDVSFSNDTGGNLGDGRFDADQYLDGVERLANVGVTWVQVQLPGRSLAEAVEAVEQFGQGVIAKG